MKKTNPVTKGEKQIMATYTIPEEVYKFIETLPESDYGTYEEDNVVEWYDND
jgi:hypothetical protein